ncbi:MAG: septal ring lytic transglycosylase RlpA family protein [Gammaproteobacteria bacterium]|nr:septal ring lytic transglycosylase RlpA family protein [Gammaproteobacteria bacterium]
MKWKFAISWLLILLLAGCGSSGKKKTGGGYYLDDGPPKSTLDLAKVKDAVPHMEPLSATGNKPYVVFGKRYVPLKSSQGFRQKGTASWYGKKFHGKRTSSGEAYDMYKMTAAHTVLPLPSYVRVTNLRNGRSVVVRVNDRGPFKHDRVMDLSYAAAMKLDVVKSGTAAVEIVAVGENSFNRTDQAIETRQAASDPLLFIQLGAFSNQDAAYSLQRHLRGAGYRTAKVSRFIQSQIELYRVRIGPLLQPGNADFILADLQRTGYPNAHYIVETTEKEDIKK